MTALNIEALMGMMRPQLLQNTPLSTPPSTGKPDGLFLNLLQSLTGNPAGTEAADGSTPGDLLATLLSLLAPQGAPNNLLATPDPDTGEATNSEATLSLTDMMTAIQTLTGQEQPNTSALAEVMESITDQASETGAALLESIQNGEADAEKLQSTLSMVMQELGMGTNPALMAAMLNVQPTPQSSGKPQSTVTTEATPPSQSSSLVTAQDTLPATAATPQSAANPAPASAIVPPQTDTANAGAVSVDIKPADTPAKGAQNTIAPQPQSAPVAAEASTQPFEQTLTRAAAQPATQSAQITASSQASPTTTENSVQLQPKQTADTAPLTSVNAAQSAPVTAVQPFAIPTTDAPAAAALPNIPALHQIADSISILKQNGQTSVRLNLHPASLGQVMVQLHVTGGDVTVQVLAETSKAQALIQNHLPELKAALSAQGLGNGGFSVAVGSDASAFNAPGRQPFNWQPSSSNNSPTPNVDGITDDKSRGSPPPRLSAGRVDYQV